MNKFEEITNKHYTNEAERIAKIQANRPLIESFWATMAKDIRQLLAQDIRFYVFDMDLDTQTLWAGLKACCNRDPNISDEVRNHITNKIVDNTKFKHIIWEL